MKKALLFGLTALLCSCGGDPNAFTIEGELPGLTGTLYLCNREGAIDSAVVENGIFRMTGTIENASLMTLQDAPAGQRPTAFAARLFVEPGKIVVKAASLDDEATISGTPSNDANALYTAATMALIEEARNEATSDERRVAIGREYDALTAETVDANLDNYFGIYLLVSQLSYSLSGAELMEYLDRVAPQYQEHPSIVALREQTERRMKSDVGQHYIDIAQSNTDDETVSLQSAVENPANKYVLLDFWASWCGPCMGEVPYLVKTYEEFHGKGFEIFGVSLDQDGDAWRKCIADKKMNWIHVSELNAWNNSGAQEYAVRAIPANFLIDAEGTIVAKNLRGEELYEKIAELLK